MSEEMDPEKLLYVLNKFFGEFDQIAQRMGVEKIKTIGDAYMAVCGAPTPDPQHKQKAMRFASALLLAMERLNVKLDSHLSIRIGLHSGPVVAGVIGRQKSIYDLWGDTVNTASRMESSGIPDYIQISESLYHELKDHYPLHARGAQRIKGKKALLKTYLMSLEELRSIPEQNYPPLNPRLGIQKKLHCHSRTSIRSFNPLLTTSGIGTGEKSKLIIPAIHAVLTSPTVATDFSELNT